MHILPNNTTKLPTFTNDFIDSMPKNLWGQIFQYLPSDSLGAAFQSCKAFSKARAHLFSNNPKVISELIKLYDGRVLKIPQPIRDDFKKFGSTIRKLDISEIEFKKNHFCELISLFPKLLHNNPDAIQSLVIAFRGQLSEIPQSIREDVEKYGDQIQKLDLSKVFMNQKEIQEVAKLFPKIKKLSLQEKVVPDSLLEELHHFKELEELNLSSIHKLDDRKIMFVAKLKNLNTLHLAFCSLITDRIFSVLSTCKALKKLNIAYCDSITENGLCEFLKKKQLSFLDIVGCRLIRPQVAKEIAKKIQCLR